MESQSPAQPEEPAVSGIIARAERAVARAGERLLVEQLHRALDEHGSAAISSFSETLLPLLQAMVIVLPQAVTEGASPALISAAQTLGTTLQEENVPLSELLSEGLLIHERLLQEIAADLRTHDREVVMAVLRISRAILEVERAALMAYQEGVDAASTRAALVDAATGLASRAYLDERLEDELQIVRRRERPLALIWLTVTSADVDGTGGSNGEARRQIAALLRDQLRSIDLAAQRGDGTIVVLLPETDRDGAGVFLRRLSHAVEQHEPPLRFRSGIAIAPDQGTAVDALNTAAAADLARAMEEDD